MTSRGLVGTNGGTFLRSFPGFVEGSSVVSSIHCPHCQKEVGLNAPRAGRFRSKCPRCGLPFVVTVPDEEGASPSVALMEPSTESPQPPKPIPPVARVDPDETLTQEVPRSLAALSPARPVEDDLTIDEILDDRLAGTAWEPPRRLGRYRVGRNLGPTRAGAAFESIQRGTGRRFLLAVVKPRWAADPIYLARFAREAFAASQLGHPNLACPVEVAVARSFAFGAAEGVVGEPLSDPRGREGLDRTARTAAILHAARGLKHAHEQGVYHRDLSLRKIRLDRSGQVILTDLGVGLTPDTPEVPLTLPVGTTGLPAPAPTDAPGLAFVRDDIVGLGRALRSLVGGPEAERALTPGLASLIRRMIGEGTAENLTDMGAVVRAIETELGVGGAFMPRDEEAAELETSAQGFAQVALARAQPALAYGSTALLGLFAGLLVLAGKPLAAAGVASFGMILGASRVAVRGIFGRDPLADRVRDWLLGGNRGDALTFVAGLGIVVAALVLTGLLGTWIFLGLVAAGLALAVEFAIDRPVEQARAPAVERAASLVRSLRLLGVEEDSIRRFVCRQSGTHWEALYQTLFGYEALRSARRRWGLDAGGRRRPRLAPWRDPIIDAIDRRLADLRTARDQALFETLEERRLEARGTNLVTSRRKARRIARAIVVYGRKYREADASRSGVPLMDALNHVAHRPEAFLEEVETDEPAGPPPWRTGLELLTRIAFGARTRLLLGGALLAGCLLWMHQNELIDAREIHQAGVNATTDREKGVADATRIGKDLAGKVQGIARATTETRSLKLDGLSPTVASRLDGFGLGVAGLILITSAAFGGTRMAAFAVPGALIAALGPNLIETGARSLGFASLVCLAIGAGLLGAGVVFGRERN